MAFEQRADTTARLRAIVADAPGRLSVAVRAWDDWTWTSDPDRVVTAASTIKVPVLLAALTCVEDGAVGWDDQVSLPVDRVGGSGALCLVPSLSSLPLRELLALMIALSDNDATNAVIDLIGFDAVTDLLDRAAARHTRLRRRMMDFAAAERGLQNETSTGDLVELVVQLRRGLLLQPAGTRRALDVLRSQQFRDGLPAYLASDVLVASKTGDLPGVRTEVALLERAERWVAIAVAATDLQSGGADRGTEVLPTFAAIGEAAARLL